MPSDDLYCWVKSGSNVEIATIESFGYHMPIRLAVGDSIDDRYTWMKYINKHFLSLIALSDGWWVDNNNSFM